MKMGIDNDKKEDQKKYWRLLFVYCTDKTKLDEIKPYKRNHIIEENKTKKNICDVCIIVIDFLFSVFSVGLSWFWHR